MTVTTSETLTVGGLVLNTLGYNIEVAAYGVQTREPRHQPIARRAGAIRRRPRERPAELDISMWVTDRTAAGVPGGSAQMWTNVNTIIAAVSSVGALVPITKIRGGLTLTTEAELAGAVVWERVAASALRVTIPMVMPYPYWLGGLVDVLLTGGSGTVTNVGQVEASDVGVTLRAGAGGWNTPTVLNSTASLTLSYNGSIAPNDVITINLFAGTALNSASQSVSGRVNVNGPFWTVQPGANTIVGGQASGSGNVGVSFRSPYFV